MYKYIITWIVASIQSAPCPDANRVSEFGISNNNVMSCAVYHTQTVKTEHKREFYSKDSSRVFFKKINEYTPDGWISSFNDRIESIKLDSINIKQ